ncbi:MAG TPA: uroporphyrinogen-III synthase [Noviherbaspirillum sp.]|uniref:uroporphyrinogen-III synthase n=1 Tax=Noviherbaspirillum sp. TaxID=1926288 RepID=UPI002B465613|nr:uroporphyrinogen-III synthase [Noviherbaspirillum sp.]HJV85562.1 uroporphyrinogen-III synthase [Noviherbaspirillum sp.]
MTNSPHRPVVVTRPLAQARPLAERIAATGRDVVVFPLLEIQPLPDQTHLQAALASLENYAMVAFVSPNAIDAAFRLRAEWPRSVAIAVMGAGSKAALAQHGLTSANAKIISPVDPQRTDSQTLLEVLEIDALRDKRVLIVRGETGRELLADALRDRGVLVEQVAAYRRCAPVLDETGRAKLARLLEAESEWIITSSEALRTLIGMVRDLAGEQAVVKLQRQRFVVPHVRIAENAKALGFTNLVQTGSGDEQVLAALQFRA